MSFKIKLRENAQYHEMLAVDARRAKNNASSEARTITQLVCLPWEAETKRKKAKRQRRATGGTWVALGVETSVKFGREGGKASRIAVGNRGP